MNRNRFLFLIQIPSMFIFFFSCSVFDETDDFEGRDYTPPIALTAQAVSPNRIIMTFNENISVQIEDISCDPDLDAKSASAEESTLTIEMNQSMAPGKEYVLSLVVSDEKNNSISFLARVYGYNDRIPGLLINEFTCQGSGNHPDLVELICLKDGNLSGVTFIDGVPGDFTQKYVFSDLEVNQGDFILIHTKPEDIAEELTEKTEKDLSGGRDCHNEAWDVWMTGGSGLSGNNGCISLLAYPYGPVIDAVLYSNRTSASDEKYKGFGSASTLFKAEYLKETGHWEFSENDVKPEDAVDPEDTTSTRSLCRSSDPADSNNRSDWHIVPTSTYSFGEVNSNAVYE